MERQQEYLRLLQERNRLKKMMTEKSEEDLMKEELERGFSTHFRGVHAVKEKTTTNRFEGKPSVKVHKSPNNIDLIKRLNPSNLGEDIQSETKFTTRSDSRVTPRVAERSVSFRGEGEGESEYEEVEPREETDEDHEGYYNQVRSNPEVSVKQPSANINQVLLGQITSMSEEQKFALLQLLQANVSDGGPNPSSKTPKITSDNAQREGFQVSDPGTDDFVRQEDIHEESPPLPNKKPSTLDIQNPSHNPDVGTFDEERVIGGSDLVMKSTNFQDLPVNLKIKISSTWQNSKNVFLQGIRLRCILEKSQGQIQFIDLFQHLKVKLLHGLSPVSATNESFRLVNNLLGVGLNFKGNLWKSLISAQNAVELVFEGSIPGSLFQDYSDKFQGIQDLIPFIELSCWNGYEDNSDNNSINASAAKDIDIFVNDSCLWTGVLEAETRKLDILRAADNFTPFTKSEAKASLVVKPFIRRPKTGTSSVLNVRMSGEWPNSSRVDDTAFVKKLFSSPTRSKPVTPGIGLSAPSITVDGDKPDWLKFGKEAETKSLVLTPSTKEKRLNAVRLNDANLRSPERLLQENDDNSVVKSPTRSVSKTKLNARRRRAREVGSFDSEAGITLSPNRRRTPKTLGEVSKDIDSNLRKSLEAIEHSEKFNLNRLETTVARNPAVSKRVSNDPSVNVLQLNKSESTKKVVFVPDEEMPPSDSNESNIPPKLQMEEGKSRLKRNDSGLPPVGESTRAAKIEKVNAKLNTALTDLAEILAGLPKQAVVEEERNNDTIEKIRSVQQTPRVIAASLNSLTSNSNDLPKGRVLVIEIFTTHGDMSYVGLNGLEFFDQEGNSILSDDTGIIQSITAHPMDLGVLPGYSDDPRKIENLLDGINNTKDDLHQWLAPHVRVVNDFINKDKSPEKTVDKTTSAEPIATITVTFSAEQTLSMLKIYNFNKSRTHNQRGVRDIRIVFDQKTIFAGVIKKATGFHNFSEDDYQIISFTSNEKIIQHATPFKTEPEDILEDSLASPKARPRTSDGSSKSATLPTHQNLNPSNSRLKFSTTSLIDEVLYETEEFDSNTSEIPKASLRQESNTISSSATTIARTQFVPEKMSVTAPALTYSSPPTGFSCLPARLFKLELENSWGDSDYIGLNGIEVLGSDGNPLKLSAKNIVMDGSSLGFESFDDRKVDNIVNGINHTANDQFMWLITRESSRSRHFVEFDLKKNENISGIRIWNYNGSNESSLRGCKYLTIYLDKKIYFRTILRPSPECDGIDYSQTIYFSHLVYEIEQSLSIPRRVPSYISPKLKQTYETSVSICGLLWKFTLLTNHGDDYYIGLDHIEFFDNDNQIIPIDRVAGKVSAVPSSVRDLSNSIADPLSLDPRIPDRLFDSTYFTDPQKRPCWLSPLAKCMTGTEREACVNRLTNNYSNDDSYNNKKKPSILPKENTLFVLFPYPVTVSAIKFYNYSKTPDRGVCEYSLHVDGNIVFMGSLVKSNEECPPHHSKASINRSQGQVIVFSNEPKVINAHKDLVAYYNTNEQDVLCINERQVMVRSKTMYDKPGIAADLEKRPTTSYFS